MQLSKKAKQFKKRLDKNKIKYNMEVNLIPGRKFKTDFLISYRRIRLCCEIDSPFHDIPSQKKSDKEKDKLHKRYWDIVIRIRDVDKGIKKIKQTVKMIWLLILLKRSIFLSLYTYVYFTHIHPLPFNITLF